MDPLSRNIFHYSIATRIRAHLFLEFVRPRPGDKILDLGSGVGYFCGLMLQNGAEAYGLDLDHEAVLFADRASYGRFCVGRAERLPFGDSTFDKILCSEVLEHVEDDGKVLEEIRRVAKPGATVVITVPTPEGVFGSKLKSICHGCSEQSGLQRHVREGYGRSELEALLGNQGIRIDKTAYTMVFLTEMIMGATKVAFSFVSGRKNIEGQSRVFEVSDSLTFKVYRKIFPFFMLMGRLDDLLLAPFLKGHAIVMRGLVEK